MLEEPSLALKHARRCQELSEAHRLEKQDFDVAYAFEALARGHALAGDRTEAELFYQKASLAGEAIADPEDKEIFLGDFKAGKWYGINYRKTQTLTSRQSRMCAETPNQDSLVFKLAQTWAL